MKCFTTIRWLRSVYRVRGCYNSLSFGKRLKFMEELRPSAGNGAVIAYPDALMFITEKDVNRAVSKALDHRKP